jgi:hypothetical protein
MGHLVPLRHGPQLCELFAHVRSSKMLAGKQVIWEEIGVGIFLTNGPNGMVYDWNNTEKIENFLREQERWNCYLGKYAAVGTDNAAVSPKYNATFRGLLCGRIDHVLNEWHFHNRSLPAVGLLRIQFIHRLKAHGWFQPLKL